MNDTENIDAREIEKFGQQAARWWDVNGAMWTLHAINPLRLSFIDSQVNVAGMKVLDVGCGGGILTEALAHRGADVTGIDASEELIEVAKLHALEVKSQAKYRVGLAEAVAEQEGVQYDVVTCMEMLEHVPDPMSVLQACTAMVKPKGWIILSTLNRNPKSFFQGIVGAEYILNLVPKGTHSYSQFIKPSELSGWCRQLGLAPKKLQGLSYNLIKKQFYLTAKVDVNYMLSVQKS